MKYNKPISQLKDTFCNYIYQITNNNKYAFTLAETLITLMVIGVVAVLTMPALMQNISEYTLGKQRQTTASKIAEGFSRMRVAGALETKYSSTEEFVNTMKKYFQLTQTCKSNELQNCFTESVLSNTTKNEENTVEKNKISEMKNIKNVMGIKFSDGVSMLIAYNTEGDLIDAGNTEVGRIDFKGNNTLSYPVYGNLFKYVFDINNKKSPNTIGKDVIGNLDISKEGMYAGLGFEIIDDTVFSPEDYSSYAVTRYYEYWGRQNQYLNYWLGAMAFCEEKGGRMANNEDFMKIAQKLNGGTLTCDAGWSICYATLNIDETNSENAALLGLFSNLEYIWSADGCKDGSTYSDYNCDTDQPRIYKSGDDWIFLLQGGDAGTNVGNPMAKLVCVK